MNQDFDSEVLDLVKEKGAYLYEQICDFEKFNETNENDERLSQFELKMRCFIVSWCI